jgi:segregation and condensation protein B
MTQQPRDDFEFELSPDELTLEQLGAVYARALSESADAVKHGGEAATPELVQREDEAGAASAAAIPLDESPAADADVGDSAVNPSMIVEAALFVGHPEAAGLTAEELSQLMRDVSSADVRQIIQQLNADYEHHRQAWRIVPVSMSKKTGDQHERYRMALTDDLADLRAHYLGRDRQVRLSQAAVEVLALVAYQPAITADQVQTQRGRESAALLTQLVKRQLLRMERRTDDKGRRQPHYFPTDRFLELFGLSSLAELPEVDEVDRYL